MWKYRCKSQVISLVLSFLAGVLVAAININGNSLQAMLTGLLPEDMIMMLTQHPYILYLSGGLFISGICNIFLITNMLSSQFNTSPILCMLPVMFFPEIAITLGAYSVPVTLAISIYGWISLNMSKKKQLAQNDIANADEIIRIYKLHHTLEEKYKPMAVEIRKTIRKINWVYALGIVAIICVMFFIDNLTITLIAIFLYMFAFQYLQRARAASFKPISDLLYQKCDPQACMSALIYFCEGRNGHYKLTSQALMASCLIYMDDPHLAQDVLITFPLSNNNANLTYYSLMASTYYMLKDENGLERCKEAIAKIKPSTGAVGLMIKSEEQQSINNKINLMNQNFSACKQFFLERFKKSPIPLQKADCAYYLALISFVQEDYPVAEVYFEKAIQLGNTVYFVKKAQNYLAKIKSMNGAEQENLLEA